MLGLKSDCLPGRLRFVATRSACTKLLVFLLVLGALHLLFSPLDIEFGRPSLGYSLARTTHGACPAEVWASGRWVPQRPPTERTHFNASSDAYEFLGFEGCASNRELWWHLGADAERLFDRFPAVASWRWEPPSECGIREMDGSVLVKHLVEEGGWLLIGDSVTENHFFSLSCMLYPHVRATPDWTQGFDRAWPQHLYLNPSSPLASTLSFPPGFDIAQTPLVTFRRVDTLLPAPRLDALYRALHPDSRYTQPGAPGAATLLSDEPLWNLSPAECVRLLTAPRPHASYATMVVSTAGHWTTHLFAGLRDPEMFNDGIANVVDFFGEAMAAWADEVQALLDAAASATGGEHVPPGSAEERGVGGDDDGSARALERTRAPRRVVVRAYLPGHEDCHDHREPLRKYRKGKNGWYNWNQMGDFNRAFERVLSSRKYRDIHFLPIDRPALLRPDAHVSGDCLHVMSGAGVLEGWTHYIWHFVTAELPARMW